MLIGAGQGDIIPDNEISNFIQRFRDFKIKLNHNPPNSKRTKAQKPFLYIDKCHYYDKLSKSAH